ncbi:MAG: penicillin acylase family protein [Promethearchaeia archaeon]
MKLIKKEKILIKKLSIVVPITIFLILLFSVPLISVLAPLGNILFPGGGIWRSPGEVPESEVLYIDGMDAQVTVYRDEWGIPHIYAETEADLGFTLGYIHAQDRFFQMDLARRQVRGLLSEVIGESALEMDKYNLAMGMEYWANESLQAAEQMQEDGEIEFLDSWKRYTKGINHYLNTHQGEWPMEYSILGFKPTDRPWTLLDSMCYSKYMSKMLTWEYSDLYRYANRKALGNDSYDELYGPNLPYQIPVVPGYGDYNNSELLSNDLGANPQPSDTVVDTISTFLKNAEEIESEKALMDLQNNGAIGSNNWVVDGNKSSTGKPILCNDMHLAHNMPGIWYETHLVSEDTGLNTYGFTLAGVPLPIVAHNEHVAWGLTNTNFDVLDWYYYEETDDNHYIYNESKTEYEMKTYNIPVKGGKNIEFEVKNTVHGPVLNDFLDNQYTETFDNNIVLAPRWTANNVTNELLAVYEFNHAKTRADFNESSRYFHNPAQNFVYADIDGNIAMRPTGLVPFREGNGTFPYNGSSGEGEWTGYTELEDLPEAVNPDQNYLASANQISVGPNFTKENGYLLQNNYRPGYRARRINELLNNSADGTVGVEKMKEIQLDQKSSVAQSFTEYLIDAIEDLGESDRTPLMDDALTYLKNWDYDMDKDLPTPAIFRKWRDLFMDHTFTDEFEEKGALGSPELTVLEYYMKEHPDSHWFNDITTDSKTETRDDIIIKAFEDTLDFLKDFYDTDDISQWRWGELHKVKFPHLIGQDSLSKGPYEVGGSGYTVNPAWSDISEGVGIATSGASERMIVDFSDLEKSWSCIPSGQRGITNSKHYSDQLEELFLEGKYHQQYFYDNSEDFPKQHVETYLIIRPSSEFNLFLVLTPTFIIVGFIAGLIGLYKVFTLKTKETPRSRSEKGFESRATTDIPKDKDSANKSPQKEGN